MVAGFGGGDSPCSCGGSRWAAGALGTIWGRVLGKRTEVGEVRDPEVEKS